MDAAEALRRRGGPERLTWTTGSWLVYEYLERASGPARARMEAAILAGDLAWHALPFTSHSEAMDASLFRTGLGLSRSLDARFGRKTIAAKLTDVPGHTRGIVPLLAEAGVEFLHVGVNEASRPPKLPPVFVWRDGAAEIAVMYSASGYGDSGRAPGADDLLVLEHRGDNAGPPSFAEVLAAFARTRARFPGAQVLASTLDAYALTLREGRDSLPVIEAEIGDSWIHGIGSDPRKLSRFRELQRLRRHWIEEGSLEAGPAEPGGFDRRLILIPEHTWGLDTKGQLAGDSAYAPADFRAARARAAYARLEASWAEKRAYDGAAVDALESGEYPRGSELAAAARAALAALEPSMPELDRYEGPLDPGARRVVGAFELGFDLRNGAIIRFRDLEGGRDWASASRPIASILYQAFSSRDYERFWRRYIANRDDPEVRAWARMDFTKPGLAAAGGAWEPRVEALFRRDDGEAERLLLLLRGHGEAVSDYGCPRTFALELSCPRGSRELRLELQWFGKAACRSPEATWLRFSPVAPDPRGWTMHKLGEWVSPLEVVRDGGSRMHGLDRGLRYRDAAGSLELDSLDAPLVAPHRPSLLDFGSRARLPRGGMHFNLHNNVWGTNFVMWYEDDARFRFAIRTSGKERG
jgi:hypothetical protein